LTLLFALIAYDKPNGLPERLRLRPRHLEFLEGLGLHLKLAGPLLDAAGEMNGSIIIIEADNQGEAEALFGRDPYQQEGLFGSFEIRAWKLARNQFGAS
jgi:uncharacterized protein YciI